MEASQQYEAVENAEIDVVNDDVLLQASQQYYEASLDAEVNVGDCDGDGAILLQCSKDFEQSRFGNPVTNEDLEDVRKSGVPVNTRKNAVWALNVWKEWVRVRANKIVEDLEKEHSTFGEFR